MPNLLDKKSLRQFHAGFLSARVGEWLYVIALNWLVLVETTSPMLLATINVCRLLPALLFSVPAGKLADRFERKNLNRMVAVLNAVLVGLTGLAFALHLPFLVCALLVVIRAVVIAAEAPFRHAYLCGVLEGDSLKSVVAQNASVMNFGRILGPTLAGFSLAYFGGFATFLLAGALCFVYSLT